MLRSVLLLRKNMIIIFTLKFEILQVRKNGISPRRWFGGTAHLCDCSP